MPKNRQLPEVLLSKLHGKGTMSEILDIERTRLLKQSEQDMRRQLASGDAAQHEAPTPEPHVELDERGQSETAVGQPIHGDNKPPSADSDLQIHQPPPLGTMYPYAAIPPKPPSMSAGAGFPHASSTVRLSLPLEVGLHRTEGLSNLSRVVGDDLSEFGTIFRHSSLSASSHPHFSPEPCRDYYTQIVEPTLAFTAERNLLGSIRRLTLGWGTLSCQITFELLSVASGIRNIKTLRKWLSDLHNKKHIRYTPVHGDLRGSVITLTPPPEVRAMVEQWWNDTAPGGERRNSSSSGSPTERSSDV